MPGGQRITGRDPAGQSAAEHRWSACPDWGYEIEVLLAEGKLVAAHGWASNQSSPPSPPGGTSTHPTFAATENPPGRLDSTPTTTLRETSRPSWSRFDLPPGLSSDPTGWAIFRHETERSLGSFNVATLGPHVRCPVLVLQADPAYGSQLNDADAAELLQLFPHATHAFIHGCGHGLWRIQKEPVLSAILSFLDTIPPGAC
jgi:pimeloyl-ACP methyl ester carboxylesterase